ncbi:hypothetical protein [Streptomyces sp. NPDC102437]|uniref:hypothetical protein n=1 Tax=Streptomyces sp. NPDC102437 TaxID=3366175 RepID=UPI0038161953
MTTTPADENPRSIPTALGLLPAEEIALLRRTLEAAEEGRAELRAENARLRAAADRAAILREAADAVLDVIGTEARLPQTISGVYRAADHLRRMADKAQQPAPAVTEEPGR